MKHLFLLFSVLSSICNLNSQAIEMEKMIIDKIEVTVYRDFFDDGKVSREWTQAVHELHGFNKDYFPNGKLRRHDEYYKNKLYKVSNEWYETGKILKEVVSLSGKYYLNYYYPSGSLESSTEITENIVKSGEHITYFENGKIKSKENFDSKGNLIGNFIEYDNKGDTIIDAYYHNYEMNFTKYYRNVWDNNGKQVIKNGNGHFNNMPYKNGVLHGECISYNEKNIVTTSSIYSNGRLLSSTEYYDNGVIKKVNTVDTLTSLFNYGLYKGKFKKPKLITEVIVFMHLIRDENNVKVTRRTPTILNMEEVLKLSKATESIYNGRFDNEQGINEVFVIKVDKEGKVKTFYRSSGSYIGNDFLDNSVKNIVFDVSSIDDIADEIMVRYHMYLIGDPD